MLRSFFLWREPVKGSSQTTGQDADAGICQICERIRSRVAKYEQRKVIAIGDVRRLISVLDMSVDTSVLLPAIKQRKDDGARVEQFERLKRLHESGIIRLHVSGSQVLNDLRDEDSRRGAQDLMSKVNMERDSSSYSFTLEDDPDCLDFFALSISPEERTLRDGREARNFWEIYRAYLKGLGKVKVTKRNDVVDINHMITYYLSGNDIFLTNDKKLINFGECKGEELRICIQKPANFLAEYEDFLYTQLSRLLRIYDPIQSGDNDTVRAQD